MDAQNDVDMMDTDAPPPPPPSSLPESSSLEVVRGLLTVARQLIDQGKPSEALQAVLTAMKAKGVEAAALQALNRAKELYRNKIHETTAADELASLFAEFAIAESLQAIPEPPSTSNNAPGPHHLLNQMLPELQYLQRPEENKSCLMRSLMAVASFVNNVVVLLAMTAKMSTMLFGVGTRS
ncbi:hypothetical protein HanRHA438_Chr04g0161631 [Helianthus annuus]|nr:hypothetical protein HanRHA438_Chr04g0161631 [Helianthus annuus]